MKKSKQINAVVYSGKVGAKMRAKRVATSRATPKEPMFCRNGPMKNHLLYVTSKSTLVFTLNGRTGRYVNGIWEQS